MTEKVQCERCKQKRAISIHHAKWRNLHHASKSATTNVQSKSCDQKAATKKVESKACNQQGATHSMQSNRAIKRLETRIANQDLQANKNPSEMCKSVHSNKSVQSKKVQLKMCHPTGAVKLGPPAAARGQLGLHAEGKQSGRRSPDSSPDGRLDQIRGPCQAT